MRLISSFSSACWASSFASSSRAACHSSRVPTLCSGIVISSVVLATHPMRHAETVKLIATHSSRIFSQAERPRGLNRSATSTFDVGGLGPPTPSPGAGLPAKTHPAGAWPRWCALRGRQAAPELWLAVAHAPAGKRHELRRAGAQRTVDPKRSPSLAGQRPERACTSVPTRTGTGRCAPGRRTPGRTRSPPRTGQLVVGRRVGPAGDAPGLDEHVRGHRHAAVRQQEVDDPEQLAGVARDVLSVRRPYAPRSATRLARTATTRRDNRGSMAC